MTAGELQGSPQVVVVGAGMGGLQAVRQLSRSGARVTLVDQNNYSTFAPMLFYVAAAFLSPEDVVRPVRALIPAGSRIDFRVGEVRAVDWDERRVILGDGDGLSFDCLVLAPGVVPAFGDVAGAPDHAIPMKSALDASRVRNSLLGWFETAAAQPARADGGATSVAIVGGGTTGVEVAGYLSDFLFRYSFRHDYPRLAPERLRVTLIEAGTQLLPGLHPKFGPYALRRLRRRGVDVRLGATVASVDGGGVTLVSGERIRARTVVWAGGIGPAPWIEKSSVALERGRIIVDPDLRLRGRPTTFAVGDCAAVRSPDGTLYPPVAQVALQTGRHAGRQIRRLMTGQSSEPFRYRDKGSMAMVGRNAAVVQAGPVRMTGVPAWFAVRLAVSSARRCESFPSFGR